MKLLMLAGLLVVSSAFGQSSAQLRERAAIDALINSAHTLSVRDLSCLKNSDCGALELGSKACGGPNGYVIVSHRNHNIGEIARLAELSVRREAAYNEKYHVISDCMMMMAPAVKCVARTCVQVRY